MTQKGTEEKSSLIREVMGAENEESWLNAKLWPSSEAQRGQRKSDPDNQFCIVPIISMEKSPGVILGWLFLPHFLNKYLRMSLLYTGCQIRNVGPKQPREIGMLPSYTHHNAQGSCHTRQSHTWWRMDVLSLVFHVTEFIVMGKLPVRGMDDFSCKLMTALYCSPGSW